MRNAIAVLAALAIAAVLIVNFRTERSRDEKRMQEIKLLREENSRLRDQRSQLAEKLANLQGSVQPLAEHGLPGPVVRFQPGGQVGRVLKLRDFLAEHPEETVPELRLLDDQAWLRAANGMSSDTEADLQKGAALLRSFGEQAAMQPLLYPALKGFMAANGGQIPSDPSQLAPYLSNPPDAEFLSTFKIFDGTAHFPTSDGSTYVLQTVPADGWYNYRLLLTSSGIMAGDGIDGPGPLIEEAITKFRQATGTSPTDVSQITPYLQSPLDSGTATAVFRAIQGQKN